MFSIIAMHMCAGILFYLFGQWIGITEIMNWNWLMNNEFELIN